MSKVGEVFIEILKKIGIDADFITPGFIMLDLSGLGIRPGTRQRFVAKARPSSKLFFKVFS